jgi:4-hydroxy-4-methyl-2-oxoglutarate aldolase
MMAPPVSAVADVLALWGLDGWLTPPLRPVVVAGDGSTVVSGGACTVQIGLADEGPGLAPLNALLSTDLTGRALVLGVDPSLDAAVWGEIFSCSAQTAGACLVLVDGAVRDRPAVLEVGLPLYSRDERVVGPAGRAHVLAIHQPVTIDAVEVSDGDLVIADDTGCVRVRASMHEQVLDAARRYAESEERVVAALRAGESLTSAYRHKKAVVDQLRRS